MAATLATVSAAEFARDPAHDAAIDRAITTGKTLFGDSFYVALVANMGNYLRSKEIADRLGVGPADSPAAAFVGAVSADDVDALGLVIVNEAGETYVADFPTAATDAVVLVIKDDTLLAFTHSTKAADGRAERAQYRAYLADVQQRTLEAEPDPALLPAASDTDWGSDISTFILNPDGRFDLDPTFSPISGRQVVVEAVARRLTTQRGALEYDPNFGLDLRLWLNSAHTDSDIFALATAIEAEAEKDERVLSATANVQYSRVASELTVRLFLDLVTGERFRLVLTIDSVTAEILKVT